MTVANWLKVFSDLHLFVGGFGRTVLASALALGLALGLGLVFGLVGAAPWRPLRFIQRVYVEIWQNTPLVLQVFFMYNGLPYLGVFLPVLSVGVLGLGIYHGAYISEVVRGGIGAIHRGQLEAAYSQGFSYVQAMRYVILPQALRVILPPLTNQVTNLVKNSAVLAMVAGADLMYYAYSYVADTAIAGPPLILAGLAYLVLNLPLSSLSRWLEARQTLSQGGVG